jgi:hypothetical protein
MEWKITVFIDVTVEDEHIVFVPTCKFRLWRPTTVLINASIAAITHPDFCRGPDNIERPHRDHITNFIIQHYIPCLPRIPPDLVTLQPKLEDVDTPIEDDDNPDYDADYDPNSDSDSEPQTPTIAIPDAVVRETKLFGYDQVVALYEESINKFYRRSWSLLESSMIQWSHDSFDASFKSVRVKLLSSKKAVVIINLKQGFFGVDK